MGAEKFQILLQGSLVFPDSVAWRSLMVIAAEEEEGGGWVFWSWSTWRLYPDHCGQGNLEPLLRFLGLMSIFWLDWRKP
jgi:hypothetical protein